MAIVRLMKVELKSILVVLVVTRENPTARSEPKKKEKKLLLLVKGLRKFIKERSEGGKKCYKNKNHDLI